MSDKKTSAQIEGEFRELCARAGFIQFQVFQLKSDLNLVNEQLREANTAGLKAKREEADAAKAAETAPEVTSV